MDQGTWSPWPKARRLWQRSDAYWLPKQSNPHTVGNMRCSGHRCGSQPPNRQWRPDQSLRRERVSLLGPSPHQCCRNWRSTSRPHMLLPLQGISYGYSFWFSLSFAGRNIRSCAQGCGQIRLNRTLTSNDICPPSQDFDRVLRDRLWVRALSVSLKARDIHKNARLYVESAKALEIHLPASPAPSHMLFLLLYFNFAVVRCTCLARRSRLAPARIRLVNSPNKLCALVGEHGLGQCS